MTELRFTRRAVIVSASASLLASCAPKPVILDKSSLADVKRVGIPTTGFPDSPDVQVIAAVGRSFGAIGIITTSIVQGNRSKALTAMMASHGFDPHAYFEQQLVSRVATLGFAPGRSAADGARQDFLPAYGQGGTDDAVLDVYVRKYGFFAAGDSDRFPFRPGISVRMRLVSRDRSVLMQDSLDNTGVDAPVGGAVPASFTTFSDVEGNPDLALSSFRLAFDYAADAVRTRLT